METSASRDEPHHCEFVRMQQDRFLRLFHEMNDKAQDAMSALRDEPETALEYLKKVEDTLVKLEAPAKHDKQDS